MFIRASILRVQSPVMVLVRTDRLRARLAVPERWAGWVKDGATVDLQVEAFPERDFSGQDIAHQSFGFAGFAHI